MNFNGYKSSKDSHLLSLFMSFIFFLVSIPLLATTPQTGDGAEFLTLATQGGVAHPPGFPIQTWLHRLFTAIPIGQTCWKLSLISLLFQTGTLFFMLECLGRLGCDIWSRILAFLAFSTLPIVWHLAVQPEVFAGALFFETFLLFWMLRLSAMPPQQCTLREAALLGLIIGLAGSQHPIVLVALPAMALSYFQFLRSPRPILKSLALFGTVIAVLTISYGSLPLQRSSSLWPDWGRLNSVTAVIRHMLRSEYGTFTLSDTGGRATVFSAIGLLLDEAWSSWWLLTLFVPLGLIVLTRTPNKRIFYGICLTFLLSLLLLWRSSVANLDMHSLCILSRFIGTALLPATLLMAIAFHHLLAFVNKPQVRLGLGVVVCGGLCISVPAKYKSADASQDHTLLVYLRAMRASLPADSLIFASTDIETFTGLPDGAKTLWPFPIGISNLEWLYNETTPLFFKEFHKIISSPLRNPQHNWVESAYEAGVNTAAIDPAVMSHRLGSFERRGLLFVTGPTIKGDYNFEMARSVMALCPFTKELQALPKKNHFLSHAVHDFFSDAFLDLARFYQINESKNLSTLSERIAYEIRQAHTPNNWKEGCDALLDLSKTFHPKESFGNDSRNK